MKSRIEKRNAEGYSAWKVWCHPGLTAKVLADFEQKLATLASETEAMPGMKADITRIGNENSNLRYELDKERDEVKKLKADIDKLNKSILVLTGECGRQRNIAKELEREKEALQADLDLRVEAEQQIAEFEKVLQGVEEMKARYERRITRLRQAVTELRANQSSAPAPKSIRQSDSDWLESLPD